MSVSDEDLFFFVVIASFIIGLILVFTGGLFIGSLGFLGIETQQTIFEYFDFMITEIQGIIRFLIVPVYIFIVGLLGLFILSQTNWPKKEESEEE